MLEFIVLGQIPGTNIYLSFESVAAMAVGLTFAVGTLKLLQAEWRAQIKIIRERQAIIFSRTI